MANKKHLEETLKALINDDSTAASAALSKFITEKTKEMTSDEKKEEKEDEKKEDESEEDKDKDEDESEDDESEEDKDKDEDEDESEEDKDKDSDKKKDKKKIDEKWSNPAFIPEKEKKHSGKTVEELRAARKKLMAKKDRTPEETSKLKKLNFAIRAKTGWGKVE